MLSKKYYIQTANILKTMNNKSHPALFSKIVNDFAELFAKDNPAFDVNKFHKACGYNVPKLTTN